MKYTCKMRGCYTLDWFLKVQLPLFFMHRHIIVNSECDEIELVLISYQNRIARHFLNISNFQVVFLKCGFNIFHRDQFLRWSLGCFSQFILLVGEKSALGVPSCLLIVVWLWLACLDWWFFLWFLGTGIFCWWTTFLLTQSTRWLSGWCVLLFIENFSLKNTFQRTNVTSLILIYGFTDVQFFGLKF